MLGSDKSVIVMGEGVDDRRVFGTTKGLHAKFGKDRVMDSLWPKTPSRVSP
jgi:pyruvate dehydrogenase E1 component beta subunit